MLYYIFLSGLKKKMKQIQLFLPELFEFLKKKEKKM